MEALFNQNIKFLFLFVPLFICNSHTTITMPQTEVKSGHVHLMARKNGEWVTALGYKVKFSLFIYSYTLSFGLSTLEIFLAKLSITFCGLVLGLTNSFTSLGPLDKWRLLLKNPCLCMYPCFKCFIILWIRDVFSEVAEVYLKIKLSLITELGVTDNDITRYMYDRTFTSKVHFAQVKSVHFDHKY